MLPAFTLLTFHDFPLKMLLPFVPETSDSVAGEYFWIFETET